MLEETNNIWWRAYNKNNIQKCLQAKIPDSLSSGIENM